MDGSGEMPRITASRRNTRISARLRPCALRAREGGGATWQRIAACQMASIDQIGFSAEYSLCMCEFGMNVTIALIGCTVQADGKTRAA